MNEAGFILDSSAALALIFEEEGQEEVAKALDTGNVWMSAVNFAEVVGRLMAFGAAKPEAVEAVNTLGIPIVPFNKEQAIDAGDLSHSTKLFGLSLGDRACLALSLQTGLPALTADKAWGKLKFHPKIRLIR